MSTTYPAVGAGATSQAASAIRRRLHYACIWAWPVAIIGFGIPFVFLAGFFPPPSPGASAADIARFYLDNQASIRFGLIGALFASSFLLPFYTVVSKEIRRIEGRGALLAPIQFGGAVILVAFFQIICLFWLLASFRPDISPEIIRGFNDYGWLVWTMLIPTYSMQYVCMAIAGFMDTRPDPTWPRWAAYMNLWVATIGAGGVAAVFFKSGPFSWDGIVGIWLPTVFFAAGMTVNTVLLYRRAKIDFTTG
ncbi:hypothetical protein FHT40_005823 [Mycolicibacterium sp. BK556]|uniref:hypothetical protein n=1 Tax=Mycolicibacterium sp. BK556 TaxID=2587125 RepID=UPI00161732FF|nr:hypothetical protein [Mycolicibacterium sp. BK556]MBB3606134.1 hypothetical protein [Mycolicibacterium sp. BK556]